MKPSLEKFYSHHGVFGYTFEMRRRCHPQLLTLVLVLSLSSIAMAAPPPPEPDLDPPTRSESAPAEKIEATVSETIDITPVGDIDSDTDVRTTSNEYFFPYRRSISPRVGSVFNTDEYADERRLLFLAGFQYLYQSKRLKNYEAGLDLISNGTGRAHFGRRWIHARTRFRPYSKAGAGFKLVPEDGLATVLKLENWNVRGAVGFERLLLAPLSLRCDLELVVGPSDLEMIAALGYSWAW